MSDYPPAIAAGWHPVARAAALGRRPVARVLMGRPLVVFRGPRGPVVLHDRCPHRGMPLSAGRVAAGTIACPYHGWRFGADGACVAVPGSARVPDVRATALPVREAAGLVWTTLGDGAFPRLPEAMADVMGEGRLDRFWWTPAASRGRCLDALENQLDPAHPHHVHPWLVRSDARRRRVRVEVAIDAEGASATYHEDARPAGLIGRVFEGARATSVGRLWPPTIGEVAFAGPAGPRLSIAVVFVPEGPATTRPWVHVASPRGALPAWLKRAALIAIHRPVLGQDRRILARQAERPGGDYAIGPLDFLGPAIWAFAHGRSPETARYEAEAML